jgi:hypothetical protein
VAEVPLAEAFGYPGVASAYRHRPPYPAAFDREVAEVVAPFATGGWLDLPVTARFTWGRVNAG